MGRLPGRSLTIRPMAQHEHRHLLLTIMLDCVQHISSAKDSNIHHEFLQLQVFNRDMCLGRGALREHHSR